MGIEQIIKIAKMKKESILHNSLILTTPSWKSIISSIPTGLPIIVADNITINIQDFISRYSPDCIYTLGFDANLNNSYMIYYDQIPSLFFQNSTKAIYVDNKTKGVFASELASYLNIPIIFEPSDQYDEIINTSNMTIEEIQDLYLHAVKQNNDDIDNIILTNLNDETSLISGYVASRKNGCILPVYLGNITYGTNVSEDNKNNNVPNISHYINSTADYLNSMGLYANSLSYKRGKSVYLTILGNEYTIPMMEISDPGIEIFNNKDGHVLLTDMMYGVLKNDSSRMDVSVGRLYGNLNEISYQLSNNLLKRNKNATLIGEYRHRRYLDTLNFGGGMSQVFITYLMFDAAKFNISRFIEKRQDNVMNTSDVKSSLEKAKKYFKKLSSKSILTKLFGIVGFVWTLADMATEGMYSILEFDWNNYLNKYNNWFNNLLITFLL